MTEQTTPTPPLTEFRVTFGPDHPTLIGDELSEATPAGWLAVHAPGLDAARAAVTRLIGRNWCDIYDPASPDYPTLERYPVGEVGAIRTRRGQC